MHAIECCSTLSSAEQERDAVLTNMCSLPSVQPLESPVQGKFHNIGLRHIWKSYVDFQAHSHAPTMTYSSLVWRLAAAGAMSIQIYPFYMLYPALGWEVQDNGDYSVSPWSISNTHKPCGAWEGRWAKTTCQTLGQPPHGPFEPAKEQQQVCVAGISCKVVSSSHPFFLVAYTTCPTSHWGSSELHLAE